MMKRIAVKYKSPIFIIGLCLTGLLGASLFLTKGRDSRSLMPGEPAAIDPNAPSAVLALIDQEPEQQKSALVAIAADPKNNDLEKSRARYLLAMAYLTAYDGGAALKQLDNLENTHPVLAPHILIKRGRAYELSNNEVAEIMERNVGSIKALNSRGLARLRKLIEEQGIE